MKRYSVVIAILIFLIGNVFAFSNKNNNVTTEQDIKANIPMGINMQIDSGIMYNVLLLSATTNNGKPLKDNGAMRFGRRLVFVGVPIFVIAGLSGITAGILFNALGDNTSPAVVISVIGMIYGFVISIPMIFTGGMFWSIGAKVQNNRVRKYYQEQQEKNVSANGLSYRVQQIMQILSMEEY